MFPIQILVFSVRKLVIREIGGNTIASGKKHPMRRYGVVARDGEGKGLKKTHPEVGNRAKLTYLTILLGGIDLTLVSTCSFLLGPESLKRRRERERSFPDMRSHHP